MNNVFLFYQNNKLKGVFADKKVLKEKTLHCILDHYLQENIYQNKYEAGQKLKNKLLSFYKEEVNFMEAHNTVWSIVQVDINQIEENIKNTGYRTKYTKLKIQGRNCNKKDLYRDLAYLEVESLYDKK